jgi:hypothetical protein
MSLVRVAHTSSNDEKPMISRVCGVCGRDLRIEHENRSTVNFLEARHQRAAQEFGESRRLRALLHMKRVHPIKARAAIGIGGVGEFGAAARPARAPAKNRRFMESG